MSQSRREFLTYSSLGLVGAALGAHAEAQTPAQNPQLTPGAPTAFGTAPAVGPEVTAATFAEAEKLVQVEMTAADRAQAASNWRMQMAPNYELRTGPRKLELESTLAPATQWNPSLPGIVTGKQAQVHGAVFVRSTGPAVPLPSNEDDIAFAPVARLSRWIETRKLTSERLTEIYLRRIERL
ncbi:MAG TPA: amidase, partial [Candidatus Angelobacter sp.]